MRTETDISQMPPGDRALLPTLSAIWGGSFSLNAIALRGLPPPLTVFSRVFIGFLGLAALTAALHRAVRPHLRSQPQFPILGTGATNASLVTLFIPFSATALGIVFPGAPFTPRFFFGILIVSGAALLIDGRLRPSRRQS